MSMLSAEKLWWIHGLVGKTIDVPVAETTIGYGWGTYLCSIVLGVFGLIIGVKLFIWAFRMFRNKIRGDKRAVFLMETGKSIMYGRLMRGHWNE